MIRLDIAAERRWLDLGHGVRLNLPPLTTAILMAARRDPAVRELPAETDSGERSLAFCKAVARLTIGEWEGVGDSDGNPVPPTPEGIDALLDLLPMFEAFELNYVAKALVLDAEKNVSAPLPNGISAGAKDTAPLAEANAPTAPQP